MYTLKKFVRGKGYMTHRVFTAQSVAENYIKRHKIKATSYGKVNYLLVDDTGRIVKI